jgi:GH24 family phage-related lysozyme (muramidase)
MKTNRAGIELIKRWEGCRLTAYQDSVGVWTIGYGLTSAAGLGPVKKGMTITQQQADDYLVRALVSYEAAVTRVLARAPNEHQFAAMVSLCYNIGPGAFAKSSIAKRFNVGDAAGAADAFRLWNKAGGKVLQGLVNRREDERKLFLTPALAVEAPKPSPAPIPPPPDIEPPAPLPVPPDAGTSIAAILLGAVGALVAALAAWIIGGR